MLEAKAKWLSSLPEWDGVLSEEKRREITKEWRISKQAVSEKRWAGTIHAHAEAAKNKKNAAARGNN